MVARLTRAEQTGRNRELLLAAAREVFLERGYHGATLEHIAERAGFSKGVVYSQFRSKADLFLALLERRVADRARKNLDLLKDARSLREMLEHQVRLSRAEPDWQLLVIEFRVHAARNPELNERYAAAHASTLAGLTDAFTQLADQIDEDLVVPPRQIAELTLAIAAGAQLEHAIDPEALQGEHAAELVARLFTTNNGGAA